MKPVKPTKKVSLVLNASFQPIKFFNGRNAIRNLIVGAVRAVDSFGNIYDWKEWNSRLDFEEDHPSLRTSKSEFPIPTIVVVPGFFGKSNDFQRKKKRISSLRQIFNLYGGVCQLCENDIKFSFATRDHVIPKSKGGENYDHNIVLSCKKCNNKKGSKFPYHNIRGGEVKAKNLTTVDFEILADKIEVRPEWNLFIKR